MSCSQPIQSAVPDKEVYPRIYLYQRVVRAKLYIDSNFDRPIDVHNIAHEASFSKFHFLRLFKSIYGQTPHRYLTRVRINRAIELLKIGKYVSEVCFLVGFESLSSFSGLFKSVTGVSPSAFQARHTEIKKASKETPLRFVPRCYASMNGWTDHNDD